MKTCVILTVCFCVLAYGGYAKTIQVPGDYWHLQDALDAAEAGDEILLGARTFRSGVTSRGTRLVSWTDRPGLDRLVINKSITIRGVGVSETHLEGMANSSITISSTAAQVIIKNLTIGSVGRDLPRILMRGNVQITFEDVVFKNTSFELSGEVDVHIQSARFTQTDTDRAAYIVMEDLAILHLTNCILQSTGRCVRVNENSKLYVDQSELSSGGLAAGWCTGITIAGGQAEVTNSQIHGSDSHSSGVSVSDGGKAVLKDCSIRTAGCAVRVSGGRVEAIRSTISSKEGTGIIFYSESSGVVDLCHIDQSKIGIEVDGKEVVEAQIRGTTITNNSVAGIKASSGEIEVKECEIHSNGEAGISLDGTARAIITNSTVKNNDGWGIAARWNAVAVGWGNTVTGNQRDLFGVSDWLVKPEQPADKQEISVPREMSTIEEAIYRVTEGGTVVVESGDYSDARVAIYKRMNLKGQGQEVILGGISLFNELGNVHVANLAIIGDTNGIGILVPKGTHFQLEGSVVSNWSKGLDLLPGSTATVSNCTISENWTGIRDSSSALVLRGCSMSLNRYEAIKSFPGDLTIDECAIRDNGRDYDYAAISFSGKSALIRNSIIEGNNNFGVDGGSGSCGIESCSISENGAGVASGGTLVISGSRIMKNTLYGIVASRGDLTVISTEVAFNKYGVFLADRGEDMEKLVGRDICIRDNSSADLSPSIEQYPWPAEFEECVPLDEVSEPPLIEDFYADVSAEGEATLGWTNPANLELSQVLIRRGTDGWPTGHTDGFLVYEDLIPEAGSKVEYIDTDLVAGQTYHYAVFSSDSGENWNDRVEQGKNAAIIVIAAVVEDTFRSCIMQLRGKVSRSVVTEVDVGKTFEIYVGSSDDDRGIEGVRFSSDEVQDGNPTGEWTNWYDWNTSSDNWAAITKAEDWTFATAGEKEVWAEARDQAGQSTKCYAPISANPVEEASKQFGVSEYVRVKKSPSATLLEEPRADSTVLYQVWHRTPAKILANEDNGSYADGYAWWYVETNVEGRAFPISGWCREIDLEKNVLPTASFTHAPLTPRCGEDVVLDARTSEDSDGEIVVWRWNLNGAGGYTINPEIVYYWDKPGEYSVTLEVEDDTRGTDRITKTISVRKKSLWEQLEDLFGSVARFDSERLKEIKRELQIKNWSQEMPIYDPDPLNAFYNYSDGDLATVLIQEMDKENAPGVTYGTYILDSIREKNLVRMASSTAWQNAEVIDAYFNDLADVNVWANTAGMISEDILVGLIEHAGGSGLGISTILSLPALCKAGIGLKALDNTLYRRALWSYFECRRFEDANAAFEDAGVPPRYYKTETKDYFESLWDTYQEFGSGSDLERSWRVNLQNFLLAALEKYKFYTQIVLLKSAGELRVYDSQNRVTGLVNGEVKQEIPNSIYDEESKTAVISPATDSYRYVVVGVEQGDYGLDAISITSGEATVCTATDMTTEIGAVHQYTMNWDALSKGETGAILQVDKNGDGVFEKTYQVGSTLAGRQLSRSLVGRTSLWLWIVVGLAIGSVGVVVGSLIWTRILRKS